MERQSNGRFIKGMNRPIGSGMKKGCKPKPHSAESIKRMAETKRGTKPSIETRRKMSESHKGNKAYNWKGGLEFRKKNDERNDSAYVAWSKTVKVRDGWKCQFLNENCEGNLVAHHILPWRDYPEERYNVNNGITLCHYHHPRKRVDEKRFIETFQSIVNSKNK